MKEKFTKKTVPFTQVANSVLNNKNLSWKAKGLYAYLYSKPDDWDFSALRIKNDSTDGYNSLINGIKELEQAGYLIRKKRQDGKKDYFITFFPSAENRNLGKSQLGKTTTISNKDLNTNKEKKQIACDFKTKNGEPLPVGTANNYEPDYFSPRDKLQMKRAMERAIGVKRSTIWSQLLFGSANDFMKAYEFVLKEKYCGTVMVEKVARTLAKWYERGETRETVRSLLEDFFSSEKATKVTITPTSVFSDHTYNSWKQGKLKPKKSFKY